MLTATMSLMSEQDDGARAGTIGFWGAFAIGVGGMVGGGIFAVLGLAVQLAHGGTPIAFLVAGLVALITSYSYAKLSLAFPSQGGTVVFIDRAFGVDLVTGSLNNLLWLSYIVMLALYAYAFGSYGATFFPQSWQPIARHVLITLAVVLPGILNVIGARALSRAETLVVAVKVALLLLFVAVGAVGVDRTRIEPSAWSGTLALVTGGMIIFLAYEGFELIANSAQDVTNRTKTLPRAFYASVVFVIILYIAVSIVAIGNLPVDRIVAAKDYALAEAARPFLGSAGFTLVGIAALLSTFSAINATLYGSARLSYTIAREGELPPILEKNIWNKPIEGLIITAVLAIVLANLVDLSGISIMGSGGFLLIFAAVNAANIRLAKKTRSLRIVPILGAIACIAALVALVVHTIEGQAAHVIVLAALVAVAFLIELTWRWASGRKLKL